MAPRYDGNSEKWATLQPISTRPGWEFFAEYKRKELGVCIFDKLKNNADFDSACKVLRSIKDQSPKSIKSHLKTAHNYDVDEEEMKKKQQQKLSISNFMTTKNFNELTDKNSSIVQLTCSDLIPIHKCMKSKTIDHLFTSTYRSGFPTSFAKVRSAIIENYEIAKTLLRKDFLKRTESPAIMIDEWTSLSKKQYINLIAYFSDSKFNLGLIEITEDATSEHIFEIISKRLDEFGLKSPKVVTADGAKTNSKLARIGGMKIQKCFNHAVHLAVTDLLYNKTNFDEVQPDETAFIPESEPDQNNEIDNVNFFEDFAFAEMQPGYITDTIKLVRKTSKLVLNSPKNVRKFLTKSRLLPILDVKTRWSSLCNMLERFLEIKNELNYLYVDLKLKWPFEDDDIDLISMLINILKPCKQLINDLSSKRCNLTTADLKICQMLCSIEEIESENNHASVLKEKFLSILKTRILERRTEASDVLMYLFGNKIKSGKRFYVKPSPAKIAEFIDHFEIKTLSERNFFSILKMKKIITLIN